MGRRGGLSIGRGDLVLLHSRPRTVGMWGAGTPSLLSKQDPRSPSNLLSAVVPVLFLLTSEVGAARQGRVLSNLFGVLGHAPCSSSDESGDEQMVGPSMQVAVDNPNPTQVGQCYNEVECLAMGGSVAGYCEQNWDQAFSQVLYSCLSGPA